jgi:PIN domain-containing protein
MSDQPNTRQVRQFVLLVDTNAIYTDEENIARLDLMPATFRDKWASLAASGDVKLLIPEIVLNELAYQKYRQVVRAYREARGDLRKIESLLSLGIPSIPEIQSRRIADAISDSLKAQLNSVPRCELASIPFSAIRLRVEDIVHAALWRKAPFKEGRQESGFRDRIVLETLRDVLSRSPHSDVAFLCKDELLMRAVRDEFPGQANLGLFDTLDGYKSFLDLARVRFTPEFLHSVTAKAAELFKERLFVEVHESIRERYNLRSGDVEFQRPEAGKSASLGGLFDLGAAIGPAWTCTGDADISFGSTHLVGVVGNNEFHWETPVLFMAPYSRSTSGMLAIKPEVEPALRAIVVLVQWAAAVGEDETFTSLRRLNDQAVHDRFIPLHDQPDIGMDSGAPAV